MRKILAVTGSRSEYDIMSSVFRAIEKQPGLSLSLVVTGAHLSERYGLTVNDVKKDGFKIFSEIHSMIDDDKVSSRVIGAATQLRKLSLVVERMSPDMLLVFGDREESFTTALVGAYMNVPVVHISGGDRVVGNVDDQVRHAVTKLAHLHLTTSEESKERILKMGEQPFRVINVGNPGLDRLVTTTFIGREELLKWYDFDESTFDKPLLLLIQHVISTEIDAVYAQIKVTMNAIDEIGLNTVVSYPNSDAGSREIIRCIEEFKNRPFIKIFKNIPRVEFINTLRHAACLIGNSSCGILEAPFFKLPVVNIGNRQKERLHAENVLFVPHDIFKIKEAIRKSCFDDDYRRAVKNCSNPYGDGKSSQRIADILATIELSDKFLIKDVTY